jgi:DNA-binding XRE family transcriptional regulator
MENQFDLKISSLRYSLGQSRADFARAMCVDLQTVFDWENGAKQPDSVQVAAMIRLQQQSEAYAERTALRPAMEVELRDRHLSQIHSEELVVDARQETQAQSKSGPRSSANN